MVLNAGILKDKDENRLKAFDIPCQRIFLKSRWPQQNGEEVKAKV